MYRVALRLTFLVFCLCWLCARTYVQQNRSKKICDRPCECQSPVIDEGLVRLYTRDASQTCAQHPSVADSFMRTNEFILIEI